MQPSCRLRLHQDFTHLLGNAAGPAQTRQPFPYGRRLVTVDKFVPQAVQSIAVLAFGETVLRQTPNLFRVADRFTHIYRTDD